MGVRHVIILKFKDGIDKAAAAAKISAGLAELPGKIPEIKDYKFGPDLGLDPDRNHDYCIVGEFEDEAAYQIYATHEAHTACIVADIKPALAAGGRIAVQYAF